MGSAAHHITKRRERNSRNYCINNSNQILLSDKDKQVHIVGCRGGGRSLLSTIALLEVEDLW